MSGVVSYTIVLAISVALPLGLLIACLIWKRALLVPYLLGCATFIVSQVLLRIPLINGLLPSIDAYSIFVMLHPVLYIVFLGVTAGLFENVGRYAAMRWPMKGRRSWADGVAFGLGHGGVEALLLVGLPYLLSGVPADGAAAMNAMLGGLERLSAIALHVGLSVMVLRSLALKKGWLLWVAIALHAVVDTGIVLLNQIFGVAVWTIEIILVAIGLAMLGYTLHVKKNWRVIP